MNDKGLCHFSSLSSGINAMAANTIEDVLVNYFKKTSQWKQPLAAKLIGEFIINILFELYYNEVFLFFFHDNVNSPHQF